MAFPQLNRRLTLKILEPLAISGGLYLGFRYLAQSALLGIIAAFGYGLYWVVTFAYGFARSFARSFARGLEAARRAKQYLVPYRVSVCPNWYELLRDYRLISDDETAAEMCKKLPRCIEFSVLQRSHEDEDKLAGLIYRDDDKTFVTDVDFSIHIPETSCNGYRLPGMYFREAARPDKKELPETDARKLLARRVIYRIPKESIEAELELWKELGEKPPKGALQETLSMRQQLELGLRVPTDWWERMCASGELKEELAKTEAYTHREPGDLTGETEVVVATLPYFEFGAYYERDIERLLDVKERDLIDRMLALNGWKRGEHSAGRLEHRYFSVYHERI